MSLWKKLISYSSDKLQVPCVNHQQQYSGSGLLLFDKSTNCILLIHDYTGDYNCFGGRIKLEYNNDDFGVEKTACDELYEESRTLLSFDYKKLSTVHYVDIKNNYHNELFRCYIVKLELPLDIREQFHNIDLNKLPYNDDYFETNEIHLFPIEQFHSSTIFQSGSTKATNNLGENLALNERAIEVILAAKTKNIL
ncbi:unnamed protein product [Didymodactylos carnosus]|uniref:Nudix hydrolase domain-containing protein n=1 Tax=Didymodactylos carnosus TaxID=1234261 RepID=A0A813VI25_9BILA|nr:unnamed protein product [Didymodactylos carnosus]CAF1515168.1 unnamed protein product [Didymodactylos carnosus]CAF3633532.1 unnamed protein product [Didymodactylos carnosus]CAF4302621.1 unnamed protein product [Didymodactylos carnosus]